MKIGAVIIAFNNEQTNYVDLAIWNAKNIKRHLNLPTSIITDVPSIELSKFFDKVILAKSLTGGSRYFEDYGTNVSWHNANRANVYELTPYDQTLLLDADYVVASNNLQSALSMTQDFVCYKDAFDMATGESLTDLNSFGDFNMPMFWATVIMFRKSATACYIFDCMKMIKDNWQHYRHLYGIKQHNFRNDYALSIALNIVHGHTLRVDTISGTLATVLPDAHLQDLDAPDTYEIKFKDSHNKIGHVAWQGLDFHAMGKKYLEAIVANQS